MNIVDHQWFWKFARQQIAWKATEQYRREGHRSKEAQTNRNTSGERHHEQWNGDEARIV
ncbi:MAG TPA: hypothetical protein VHV08_11385 [Pirellulales bacterium]|jgi:hypothetical protein|nr:hypothetical protein [Pirellulales bacterium]